MFALVIIRAESLGANFFESSGLDRPLLTFPAGRRIQGKHTEQDDEDFSHRGPSHMGFTGSLTNFFCGVNSAPELLLFDLGGVLIEVDTAGIRALDGKGRSDVELWEIWLTTPVVQQYESGKISNADFAHGVLSAFKSSMDPEAFLRSFTAWTLGLFPGTKELLRELRKKYKLAFLSNSNPLHYPRFQAEWGLNDLFDYHFVSHEMGCVKPQDEIFAKTLAALPFPPADILFFDDNRLNVEAAKRAGIEAHIVRGPVELRQALQQLKK